MVNMNWVKVGNFVLKLLKIFLNCGIINIKRMVVIINVIIIIVMG